MSDPLTKSQETLRQVFVGDVHAVVEELAECRRLIEGVVAFATEHRARIVFLGDQHHTMSTVRLEVMDFWRWAFRRIAEAALPATWALVGNHDLSNDGSTHAMHAYRDVVKVVDAPEVHGQWLYLPYVHDKTEFVKICNEPAHRETKYLVCHGLFDGAKYENGHYVGDEGVDQSTLPQQFIVSGHIHKPGRFGKVWYVGSPRWRIASDANEERAVWMVECGPEGLSNVVPMDTSPFCRRIVHLQDTEVAPASPPPADDLTDVRVDVRGSTEYVLRRKAELEAAGVRVKPFRSDAVQLHVKESDGVEVAWGKFARGFRPSRGTAPQRVLDLAEAGYGLKSA